MGVPTRHELNPSYARTHLWFANLLAARQRFHEALAEAPTALGLDPLSNTINGAQGWIRYFMRDHDQAMAGMKKAQEMDPALRPHAPVVRVAVLAEGHACRGEFEAALHANQTPLTLGTLAHAHAVAGNAGCARAMLRDLLEESQRRCVPSYLVGLTFEALGERDRAFEWLDRACEELSHWLVFLDVESRFDSLRTDPGFEALRRRVGL